MTIAADMPTTIITLVHGTWANGAEWIRESSPLAEALKLEVQGNVKIEPFNWTGGNCHSARRQAAMDLRAQLREQIELYPNARRFIIAHSHGGNAALYALSDLEIMNEVAGVVCLSTPFIHCRIRPFPQGTFLMLLCAVVTGIFIPLWHLYPDDWDQNAVSHVLVPVSSFLGLLAMAAVKWIAGWLVLGHGVWKPGEYEALVDSFKVKPLAKGKLLLVRASTDEASLGLGVSTFGSWLFGKISHGMSMVNSFGEWTKKFTRTFSLGWKITLTSLFAILGGLMVFLGFGEYESSTIAVSGMFVFIFSFCFVMGHDSSAEYGGFALFGHVIRVAYSIIILPPLLVACLLTIPLGLDLAIMSALHEFYVETSPVGRFEVIHLSSTASEGLWHSLPYSDPESLASMVSWINASSYGGDMEVTNQAS